MASVALEEIQKWVAEARQQGASHVIVAIDRDEWEEYPVRVIYPETLAQAIERIEDDGLTTIVEVYDLNKRIKPQLNSVANKTGV